MQRRKGDTSRCKAPDNPNGSLTKSSKNAANKHRESALVMSLVAMLLVSASVLIFPTSPESSSPFTHGGPRGDLRIAAPVKKLDHTTGDEVEYRVVFSTGCSPYQDWQSYLFFYQAMVKQQPGTVTRIVSGCDDEEEETLQRLFDEQIRPMSPDKFKIHFTPDYTKIKNPNNPFVYFNKPFGMRHWMQHGLGFPDHPENENAIVILLDPDQLILRPFTNNNFTNTVWTFIPEGEEPWSRIEHGKPMGQLYGFGLQWKNKINMSLVEPNEPSPVDQMGFREAQRGYIVGPPYVATARDMYAIVSKWSDFVVPVHDQYPHLLAEMFAYCLAAAHLKLSHQTAVSFMVSDVPIGNREGWMYVDKLPNDEVCSPKSNEDLPNVFHFCQRYGLGPFFFGKRRLNKDFLSCASPLLLELPESFEADHIHYPDGKIKNIKPDDVKRHRFALCHMLPALNAAATYFKQKHCKPSEANFEKTLAFHEDMSI